MEATRLILVVAAALALPVADAQHDDAIAAKAAPAPGPAKPWKEVRGFGRVLDLRKPPVIIDEPGLYAIQQNWRFPLATAEVVPELIQITADDVTLDLHGFTISAESPAQLPPTLLVFTGHHAEVRNGNIEADDIVAAVRSTADVWLHHLTIYGPEQGIRFEGGGTRINDSDITGYIRFSGGSNLMARNTLRSRAGAAVWLNGDGNQVMDNRLVLFRVDAGIRILGNGNVVANNVMDGEDDPNNDTGFAVDGDHNVLRGNTAVGLRGTVLQVAGTGNTLDGNIAPPPDPDEVEGQARFGIVFTGDGNYYGDNRMAAEVPFAAGGTVQTDWGGNVGY